MQNADMRENGIFGKSFFRAKEIRDKLVSALKAHRVQFGSTGNREDILKACVAGMVDHLYKNEYGEYRNGGCGTRQKARESVVVGSPGWIVGLPKDIQFKNRRGYLCTLNLVSMVTKIDPALLAEVAPQLVVRKTGLSPRFDREKDSVVSTTEVYFNGQKVGEEVVPDPEHPQAKDIFRQWLAAQMV